MTTDRHISTFDLDALELGALSPVDRDRARAHLAACPQCLADLGETREAGDRFRAEVLPRTVTALRTPRPSLVRRLILGATLAAAVTAAALLVARPRDDGPALGGKGDPTWRVFARRAERVFAVGDGARLDAGDELRFAVEPAGMPYLLVASVDGDGQVSVYYPYGGGQSGGLSPQMRIELPDSIRLDSARGPERVFALLSRAPLSAEPVRQALRELGSRGFDAIRSQRVLPIAADVQLTIVFEKEAP